MDFRSEHMLSDFRAEVLRQLKINDENHDTLGEENPINEHAYKIAVGETLEKYRKEVFAGKSHDEMRKVWEDWMNQASDWLDLKPQGKWGDLSKFTDNVAKGLAKGEGHENFAFAAHFRMHMHAEENELRVAKELDQRVFGEYRGPLFEKIDDVGWNIPTSLLAIGLSAVLILAASVATFGDLGRLVDAFRFQDSLKPEGSLTISMRSIAPDGTESEGFALSDHMIAPDDQIQLRLWLADTKKLHVIALYRPEVGNVLFRLQETIIVEPKQASWTKPLLAEVLLPEPRENIAIFVLKCRSSDCSPELSAVSARWTNDKNVVSMPLRTKVSLREAGAFLVPIDVFFGVN